MRALALALGFTLVASLTACSSDSGSSAPAAKGNAPSISSLSFEKTELAVGKVETLKGSVDFSDPDGDFDGVEGQAVLTTNNGQSQTTGIPKTSVTTTDKTGKVVILLQLGAAAPGKADVEFWGVDKNGNKSSPEKVTFTVK
ncbi:MAG: hypothetical protein U0235_20185 [Polyangiaceae bacterium]